MRSKQDIKNEIAQVKAQIVEVKRRMTAPTSRKYELAANAIMELDSDKGMDYLNKADQLKLKEDQLDLNRAKMLLSNGTKADIGELQQLWKDNLRFMTQESAKNGTKTDAYLQSKQLQNNLEAKLKTLSPEIWDKNVITDDNKEIGYTDAEKLERETTYNEFETNDIQNKLVDKNSDGVPDTKLATVKKSIRKFIKDNNYGDKEETALFAFAEDLSDEIIKTHNTKQGNIDTNINRSAKIDNNKLQKQDNYIKSRIGSGADQNFNALSKDILKMQSAVSSDNSYVVMKGALGDAISGGDYGGMANFKGMEGLKAKLNEFAGNNPVGQAKSEELIKQFLDAFNDKVSTYNNDIKNKLYNSNIGGFNEDLANTTFNRLKANTVKMKNIDPNIKKYNLVKTKKPTPKPRPKLKSDPLGLGL